MTEAHITLTPAQMMQGALVGVMRQTSNVKKGRNPRYGADSLADWQIHIEGCLGEMAVAAWMNAFWDGNLNDLSAADVGKIEVRTRSKDWHSLILHPSDADDSRFILVTGRNGEYTLTGWITARDGKLQEYWKDPAGGRPAFFVPQEALRPMSEFRGAAE